MRYIFNHFDANKRQYNRPQIEDFDHLHANDDLRTLAVFCYDLIPGVFGPIGQNDFMRIEVMWAGISAYEVKGAVGQIDPVRGVPITNIVGGYRDQNLYRNELQILVNIYKYE